MILETRMFVEHSVGDALTFVFAKLLPEQFALPALRFETLLFVALTLAPFLLRAARCLAALGLVECVQCLGQVLVHGAAERFALRPAPAQDANEKRQHGARAFSSQLGDQLNGLATIAVARLVVLASVPLGVEIRDERGFIGKRKA